MPISFLRGAIARRVKEGGKNAKKGNLVLRKTAHPCGKIVPVGLLEELLKGKIGHLGSLIKAIDFPFFDMPSAPR